jgi:TPR repeat protein
LANRAYTRAANNGHAKAQEELGHHYRHGLGFKRDYVEAVKWYRISAKKGNPGAQYGLGEMYELGYGVPSDKKEAQYWIRKSAEGGHAMGLLRFGLVPQDLLSWLKDLPDSKIRPAEEQGIDKIANLAEKETDVNKQMSESEIIEQLETSKLTSDTEELEEHEAIRKQIAATNQKLFVTPSYFYGAAILTLILIWHYITV